MTGCRTGPIAEPPTVAIAAYRQSALATPRAAAAPIRRDVRAVSATR
jgi:hypothetical protein